MKWLYIVAVLFISSFTFGQEAETNHHKPDHQIPPPFNCDWFNHDKHNDCHPPKPPKHCEECDSKCDCCKDEDDTSDTSSFDSLVITLYPNMGIEELPAFGTVVTEISPALNPRQVFKDAVSASKLKLSDAIADGEIPNKAKYVLVARWRGYIYTKKLRAKL